MAIFRLRLKAEFEAGNLIAFSMEADGRYSVRVTDGDLTSHERKAAGGSSPFYYEARHGRVLLDGGDCLPNDDCFDEDPYED